MISTQVLGAELSNPVGMSFESSLLTSPTFTDGTLAEYLRALGPSVLRIGGNSADTSWWSSTGETAPDWATTTLTPTDLTELAKVASDGGWRVILTVNLKHFDPARAADEARYAQQTLGTALQAIEIGNEPNAFYSSSASYFADFNNYTTAIAAAAPGVQFVGSDTDAGAFQNEFVQLEHGLPTRTISALTQHYYPTQHCQGNVVTIADLLDPAVHSAQLRTARQFAANALTLKVPAILDETNSAACGGQQGVSNVFAAALWALDEQLAMASQGVSGVFVHGSTDDCTRTPVYSPLCAASEANDLVAQPVYYGLAAVHTLGAGRFASVVDATKVIAYALVNGGTLTVVLINTDDPARLGPSTVNLSLGANYSSGERIDLKAPSLSSPSGITLGGRTVRNDGTFATPTPDALAVAGSSFTVSVAAGSAAILTFH